jgi:hypothetical protein
LRNHGFALRDPQKERVVVGLCSRARSSVTRAKLS